MAISTDALRDLILSRTPENLLGPCLRDDIIPYVFEPSVEAWSNFRRDLARELAIDSTDVTIVGSGRFGFSLKPSANLRSFTDRSDIDVVVVNADCFDRLWFALLRAAYPRPPLTQRIGGWLARRRGELYTGYITPHDIHLDRTIVGKKADSVLEFRTQWFNTLKRASRHAARRHEDITGRLYRTWDHAELYHKQSIAALRRDLRRRGPI